MMSFLSVIDNTLSLNSQEHDYLIELCFVTQNNGEMSPEMAMAYEAAKDKFHETITLLKKEDCVNLHKAALKTDRKRKIFIFDEFDVKNEAFSYIFTAETVHIYGTRCLLTVLLEGIQTPAGNYHICNLAMKDLVICATNLTKDEKKELKQLVLFMGGKYLDDLKEDVTHLVSKSVNSLKYEAAAQNGVKIMHIDWVKNVWKKTQNVNVIVRGNDTQFDNYKLPIFFNLCITSTGMKSSDRNNVKTLVEENGGRYNSSFTSAVHILIMEKESIGSPKFNAATKLKKLCLSTPWIFDSVKDGYAMPVESYTLSSAKTRAASTPTKISDTNLTISKFNPDNTQLSDISRVTFCRRDISLSETTVSSRLSNASSSTSNQGFKQTLADAKKVGSVLDGYNILLNGLSTADLPLISKIISVLGATKMDSVNDQVTHVIVGTIDPQLFVDLDEHHVEAVVLKAEWLKRIVEKKSLVDESQFTISRPTTSKEKAVPEKPSPASKKAMKSLSGVFKKPDLPKFRLEEANQEQEELELVSQYLEPSDSTDGVKFLTGKYVFVYGYSDLQAGAIIINECEKFGATLVDGSFRNEVDYVITAPGVIAEIAPEVKYKNIVSDLWIDDSAEAGVCVEPVYYHKPIAKLKPHEQPLKNEVFVVSNYKSSGRSYINMLVENLGGKYKEIMKRADNGILISPNDEGKKFESAKLWSWAVVSVDWLLACLDKKQRVDETPFLIGGIQASTRNKKEPRRSIVPSSQGLDDEDSIIELRTNESHFTPARRRLTEVSTPKTPITPVLNVERLVEGMVTPQRQLTLAVLKENESKRIVSPRQKRLDAIINTPSTRLRMMAEDVDSPRPELPDCMKPNTMYFGIRPDTSPNTEACHKRKFEGLDSQYIPPPEKKRPVVQEVPTPPYAHRRYDFYKSRVPDYNSPDPRGIQPANPETQCLFNGKKSDNVSSKTLDFEEKEPVRVHHLGDEESFMILKQMENRKPKENFKRTSQQARGLYDEESYERLPRPAESEHMVEWEDVSRLNPTKEKAGSEMLETPDENQQQRQLVFSITGVQDKDKEEIIQKIEALGGKLNDDFTHLITEKPNRGEKFMMAIAGGKFVLHSDFIKDSQENGRFMDEESYEFGNPKFKASLANKFNVNEVLFKAAFKWRKWINVERIEKFKDGAFTGKAFLIAAQHRVPQFASIIKAGGGKHVDVDFKETLKVSIIKRQNVDYCLFEPNFLTKENSDLLKQCKVTTSRLSFINDFLMRQTATDS